MDDFRQDSLCQTFSTLARWANQSIAKGYASGLGILEETITDFTLNEIAILHPEYIYTKKFSRKQEGCESGADWLWCIGSLDAWLPVLVQAKVINPITKRCHFPDYSTQHGRQSDVFLRYARTHRLLPLYCIYSLIEETTEPEAKGLESLSKLESKDWACSFIIPKYVKRLIAQNQKAQSDLLRYGIPWMFPFCEGAGTDGVTLASAIAISLLHLLDEFAERDGEPATGRRLRRSSTAVVAEASHKKDQRIQWANVDPTRLIVPDIPKIVIRLLKSRVRHDDAPVSAVSIISSAPVESILREQGALPTPNDRLPVFKGPKQRERELWRGPW